jgi:hypothetical protein
MTPRAHAREALRQAAERDGSSYRYKRAEDFPYGVDGRVSPPGSGPPASDGRGDGHQHMPTTGMYQYPRSSGSTPQPANYPERGQQQVGGGEDTSRYINRATDYDHSRTRWEQPAQDIDIASIIADLPGRAAVLRRAGHADAARKLERAFERARSALAAGDLHGAIVALQDAQRRPMQG